jgi:hypothetical protein
MVTLFSIIHLPALNQFSFQFMQKQTDCCERTPALGYYISILMAAGILFNLRQVEVDLCARKHGLKHFMVGSLKLPHAKQSLQA